MTPTERANELFPICEPCDGNGCDRCGGSGIIATPSLMAIAQAIAAAEREALAAERTARADLERRLELIDHFADAGKMALVQERTRREQAERDLEDVRALAERMNTEASDLHDRADAAERERDDARRVSHIHLHGRAEQDKALLEERAKREAAEKRLAEVEAERDEAREEGTQMKSGLLVSCQKCSRIAVKPSRAECIAWLKEHGCASCDLVRKLERAVRASYRWLHRVCEGVHENGPRSAEAADRWREWHDSTEALAAELGLSVCAPAPEEYTKAERAKDEASARMAGLVEALKRLDRMGGLGHEAHKVIDAALALTLPAGDPAAASEEDRNDA